MHSQIITLRNILSSIIITEIDDAWIGNLPPLPFLFFAMSSFEYLHHTSESIYNYTQVMGNTGIT